MTPILVLLALGCVGMVAFTRHHTPDFDTNDDNAPALGNALAWAAVGAALLLLALFS